MRWAGRAAGPVDPMCHAEATVALDGPPRSVARALRGELGGAGPRGAGRRGAVTGGAGPDWKNADVVN